MSRFFRFHLLAIVALFAALPLLAQTYPMPASSSQPAAICTGCEWTNSFGQPNAGLPTYQYAPPIAKWVGRLVDSNTTASYQNIGFRTARAGMIRVAPTRRGTAPARAYIRVGEAIGAYDLSSFFTSSLPGGMVNVSSVIKGVGGVGRSPVEKMLKFDSFLYPELPGSGWIVPILDGNRRLFDFDYDDRGYVYGAYYCFGWGIVADTGGTSASPMSKVVQVFGEDPADSAVDDPTGTVPKVIISIKTGGHYYVAVSNSDTPSQHALWNVDTAGTPRLVGVRSGYENGIVHWAKDDEHEMLAIVGKASNNLGKSLKVYTYAAFVGGGGPSKEIFPGTGKYIADMSFDDDGNLWVAESSDRVSSNQLWRLKRTSGGLGAATYLDVYGASAFSPDVIHASAGYIAVGGRGNDVDGSTAPELRLLKLNGDTPVLQDTDAFFRKYYHRGPRDYAIPNQSYCGSADAVQVTKQGSKTYLYYACGGLGDFYELGSANGITASMKTTSYGTTNPNARPEQTGPFPGDVISFRASSIDSTSYTVDWNFGNPEVPSSDNTDASLTGGDVTHQYSQLDTDSKVTSSKTVTATVSSDSSLSDSVPVSLKVPVARITVPGVADAVKSAPDQPYLLVAGDVFKDASDGSIESHTTEWSVDNVATKKKPNETMSVGGMGDHELDVTMRYGKYNSSTLADGSAPLVKRVLNIPYTVLPFFVNINATSNAIAATFTATSRVASDPGVVTAANWTYTWTFSGGNAPHAATGTAPVGTVPGFPIPQADILSGSVVTLKVEVADSGLSSPAQLYNTYTATMILTPPDPRVTRSGCARVGESCSFTVGSASGASTADWSNITWFVNGVQKQSGSSKSFTPSASSISSAIAYTVTATVTKSIFTASDDETWTMGAALCGALPDVSQLSIDASGSLTAGTPITFTAGFFGYGVQPCDTITWNFGDGGSGSGQQVTHTFSSNGSYNVRFTIKNSSDLTGVTASKSYTIGSSPTTCTAPPSTVTFTQNCISGQTCKAGTSVSFTGKRSTSLALQSCDSVSWDYGDGDTGTGKTPSHKYTAAGTYPVTMTVSNTEGSPKSKTINITILPGGSSSCGPPPVQTDLAMDWNCTSCQPNQSISFTASTFPYQIQSCDTVSWDFGDSGSTTGTSASHTYTSSGLFTVKLTIGNGNGSASIEKQIQVGNGTPAKPLPVLSFSAFPTTGSKNSTVTFTVTSDIPAKGWTWNFGDGETDTSQAGESKSSSTVTHKFTTSKQYTVKVSARNASDTNTAPLKTLQNNITIVDTPEYKFLLPVVVHGPGVNSVWRTDVQFYTRENVSPANPLILTATFKGKDYALSLTKSTQIYEDFMWSLVGKDENGPVVITAKGTNPPQIWTRTYNVSAAGTFGQFIPAIPLDNGGASASSDGRHFIPGLRADARFRTNIGLVNAGTEALSVNIKVYDSQHFLKGEFQRTLQPFYLDQFSLTAALVPDLPTTEPFNVQIDVPAGQWVMAYGSLIDNLTGDPVYIQAVRESELASEDYNTVMVPGVGHTGQWRSDVTVFNPDSEGVTFNLDYFDGAGNKQASSTGTLRPLEFVQYPDILKQGILGDVPDGSGTLKISVVGSNEKHPLAFTRTYFDNGGNGSYGQGIDGFAVPRANVKPGTPALIPAVRADENYYTNIGLVNVSDTPATVTVVVLTPEDGSQGRGQTFELAPHQSIIGTFALGDGVMNGSLKVESSAGSVWAFASVIDKRTKDPEYVPGYPLAP